MSVIRSPANRLVKQALALRAPRTRRRKRLVLVEGRKAVADALAAGARFEHALVAEGFAGEPLPALARAGVAVYELAGALFERVSTTETAQGIAAVAREPAAGAAALLEAPGGAPVAVLDAVQDPGNVGTILRTAAAFGFRGALLTRGTADPFAPKVVRASAATLFRLPIVVAWERGPEALAARGFAIVCAAEGGAPPREALASVAGKKVALVVGNEGRGISEEWLRAAAARAWIPIASGVESLNAAAAFAILAYEVARAEAPTDRTPANGA